MGESSESDIDDCIDVWENVLVRSEQSLPHAPRRARSSLCRSARTWAHSSPSWSAPRSKSEPLPEMPSSAPRTPSACRYPLLSPPHPTVHWRAMTPLRSTFSPPLSNRDDTSILNAQSISRLSLSLSRHRPSRPSHALVRQCARWRARQGRNVILKRCDRHDYEVHK